MSLKNVINIFNLMILYGKSQNYTTNTLEVIK